MRSVSCFTGMAVGVAVCLSFTPAFSTSSFLMSMEPETEEPELLWDKELGAKMHFMPSCGATVADLDGDGYYEVLMGTTIGMLYVWRYDGSDYPGFPKNVHRREIFFQSAPTVGDIDGDGDVEVVMNARGWSSDGALYAWHHDGVFVKGFPIDNKYIVGTALEDLNDDHALEIIAPERDYPAGFLHVFDGTGEELPGWPQELPGLPGSWPSVGDIDGDLKPEILLGTETEADDGLLAVLYAWNEDGTVVPGFPVEFDKYNVVFQYTAPTLADFDNDGQLEIAIGAGTTGFEHDDAEFYVIEGDGTLAPGWPQPVFEVWGPATAADIDGDGFLEILARDQRDFESVYAWNYDGSSVPGFPITPGGGGKGTAAVADIDGDGMLEMVQDTRDTVAAFNHDGSRVEWPRIGRGVSFGNSPAIWDIDRDGNLELVVVGGSLGCYAYVSVYRVGGDVLSPVWPMHNHDRRHTACYDTELDLVGVSLDYFCAETDVDGVLLRWATRREYDHAGFNLYRAASDTRSAKEKLNAELIGGASPYRYADADVVAGEEYEYWLGAIGLEGDEALYGPVKCVAGGTRKFTFNLARNAPNPVRTITKFSFTVSSPCEATVSLFDITGRKVMTPFSAPVPEGETEFEVDVSRLAPGVYTYRLEAGDASAVRRMVVVR